MKPADVGQSSTGLGKLCRNLLVVGKAWLRNFAFRNLEQICMLYHTSRNQMVHAALFVYTDQKPFGPRCMSDNIPRQGPHHLVEPKQLQVNNMKHNYSAAASKLASASASYWLYQKHVDKRSTNPKSHPRTEDCSKELQSCCSLPQLSSWNSQFLKTTRGSNTLVGDNILTIA